jgi:hypothetical protein
MFVGAVSERLCMVRAQKAACQMSVELAGATPANRFDHQRLFEAISRPPAVQTEDRGCDVHVHVPAHWF